jgi:prevent-host-death family protein
MKTISQRELRNDSGAVLRQVEQGATFRVTNRGTPVATLGPVDVTPADELTLREGTQVMAFPPGLRIAERTDDVLAESRRHR